MASFRSFLDDRPEQVNSSAPTEKAGTQPSAASDEDKKKNVKPHRLNWPTLLVTMITAFASILLIFSYTQLTVLNDKIDKAKSTLEDLENESVKLNAQYEARYDLSEIEQYAQSELGMTKLDNSQVDYIEISSPDTITRVTRERFSLVGIGKLCTEIINAILDIFE